MAVERLFVKEAARRLGVSFSTVYRRLKRGSISGLKVNGKIMVECDFPHSVGSPLTSQRQEDDARTSVSTSSATVEASVDSPQETHSSGQRSLIFNWRSYYRVAF
jgi:excisionase family DNA binding protein